MLVICKNIKNCQNSNKVTCGHYTPHEHNFGCDLPCHGTSVNCTKNALRKEKIKKLNENK